MKRKYASPPIIEAVCEFRVSQDSEWDATVPGLIYEKVSKDFPNKERRVFQEVELTGSQEGTEQKVTINERVLFLTSDKKTFIQVAPNLIAVNCLKPYPSWDGFKLRIRNAFEALISTVSVKGFQRIGLRYINRITVPGERVNLDEHFEFRPFLGPKLPQNMLSFFLGCELPLLDERDVCKVQLTNAIAEEPNTRALILDLDYYLAQPQALQVDNALSWVNDAHENLYDVFEGCISDRLRILFQEVK